MQSERDVVSSGTKLSRPTVLAQTRNCGVCGVCVFFRGGGGAMLGFTTL